MKPGTPSPRQPAAKKARAQEMLQMRVTGFTNADIGRKLNMHPDSVSRALRKAAQEGLIQDSEESIVNDLVPLAIKVYREKLEKDKDPFVAKHVLDQLAKMAERVDARQKHVEEMSLDAYFKLRKSDDSAAEAGSVPESVSGRAVPDITVTPIEAESVPGDVPARTGGE